MNRTANQPLAETTVAAAKIPFWQSPWLLGALLLALVVTAYRPVWQAGYIWGDEFSLNSNLVASEAGLAKIWTVAATPFGYAPLAENTFRWEHALWGVNPTGRHLVNLSLHGATALLIYGLLRRLAVPGAWLAAALFALHPVQAEAVTWLTQRTTLLAMFFGMISLWGWTRSLEAGSGASGKAVWFAISFFTLVLAVLSHSAVAFLPVAFLLLLWWKEKLAKWVLVLPMAAVAAGVYGLAWKLQPPMLDPVPMSILERFLASGRAVWFYLGKLFWPAGLSFDYGAWHLGAAAPAGWFGWLAVVAVVALLWYGIRWFGRGPLVAFCFFLAALLPVFLLNVPSAFRFSFVADHDLYLAALGPLALAAAGLTVALRRAGQWPLACVAAVLAVVLVMRTENRARVFESQETLWQATLAQNPGSKVARRNLARFYLATDRFEAAAQQYEQALRLDPRDWQSMIDLGDALVGLGKHEEAAVQYQQALIANPQSAVAHANLGIFLASAGRKDEAIEHLRAAVKSNPNHSKAQLNLAIALAAKGEFSEAVDHYTAALRLDPNQPGARVKMAVALAVLGRSQEAQEQYNLAAELVHASARRSAEQGRLDDAIALCKEAIRQIPNNAEGYYLLGVFYLKKGQGADARPYLNQALLIRPDYPDARKALEELRRDAAVAPAAK